MPKRRRLVIDLLPSHCLPITYDIDIYSNVVLQYIDYTWLPCSYENLAARSIHDTHV